MRLSEAIRLGAMLKPQAYGPFSSIGSCALRAACDAVGIHDRLEGLFNYSELAVHFPLLRTLHQSCPVCGRRDDLMFVSYHLNDAHHWTRERIADWVESLEMQLQEQPAPVLAICETGPGR